jgi:hypothetical protein
MYKQAIFIIFAFFVQAAFAANQTDPAKFAAFIHQGEKLIQHQQSDLNSDGVLDYLLVVEKTAPGPAEGERSLLIVVGKKHDGLKLAKRNDKVVYCLSCGGVWGDPFDSVEVGKNTFTVNHYGGSAWRWTSSYTFNYSKRYDSWQLVKVVQTSFHATQPEVEKTKTFVPPKNFGLIDIADFDPQKFIGVGQK